MHALVTGAGGFLGQYIAEMLVARGDQVRALSRRNYPQLTALGIETVQGDIQDAPAVERACCGIDAVFHVAAIAGIWGPWSEYYGINTLGTKNVIEACRRQQVPRLIYTSSPSVTFAAADQCGIDETAPYPAHWLAHYPHTKALAEKMVLQANGPGLWTCALRPHLIWGPRDQHLIPRLLQRAREGKLRRVGSGKNIVDAVYVENAAKAHLQAADALLPGAPVCGKAYFITNGEPINCWEWIDEILKLAGIPPITKTISYRAAYIAGGMLEAVGRLAGRREEPRMTRFLAAQLATSHYFSIQRAQDDFGYQPRISMAEGMRRLGEWMQSPAGAAFASK